MDQDIIYEHYHKLIKKRYEYSIHIIHENSRSIDHTKWHNHKFIVTIP